MEAIGSMKKHKFIMVGTGGWAGFWCTEFLPPLVASGRIECVAAVDKDPNKLVHAVNGLGVNPQMCFTDMKEAFDRVDADFAVVVVTPSAHEEAVNLAIEHDMDVLSEKPIADSMEASVRIFKRVLASGKKMGITMSHRYDQDKATFRRILKSKEFGRLDYLVCRFTCACRAFGSWGAFRHMIADPLLVEGAIHQLDILRSFAESDCNTVFARTWTPEWGEYQGDANGFVMMDMSNGVKAFYEGAKTNAKGLNCWNEDYFRAECEFGTLVCDRRNIKLYREGEEPKQIPLDHRKNWRNHWLAEWFVDWLDGGEPMDTRIEDNIQGMGLVFAAIESSRTGKPVDVQEFIQRHLREA